MTTEVDKKVDQILQRIDPEELSGIMAEMAAALLLGQQPAMEDTYVRLSIPKPIYDVVALVCKKFDVNPEEAFSRMASEGFSTSIKNLANMATEVAEEEAEEKSSKEKAAMAQLAPGLDKIMGSFAQLQSVVNQLQNAQKVLEDAGLTDPDNLASLAKDSE